jgi:hypothetical protein
LRANPYDPAVAAAETARLRKRHTEHILAMTYNGIAMRLVRRHRLDDPRIADATRAVMVRAVMERRKKARVQRRENLANRINIAALPLSPRALDITLADCQESTESVQTPPRASLGVIDPGELQLTIDSIRKRICDAFHLAELRDADLTSRSYRQLLVFPRQLAMYAVKQLTGATLEEIGRQFGGRHHSTVLHSIRKIEEMRRLDEEMNGATTRLMDALLQ